ncbi:hypothetical protein CKM354_001166400 [Cercospora kikuchii]|uniref:Uncharacterized protein n=1 Tax=Cercospora kikuchii TaxID=84275 RepID=A0A9P3CTH7_9PEZI|nr:uncharacterized protein CKM354_001166400 [Cercospora kikuchii]GIZ48611.1 hypothetical protein CKM354_001166400 [Cercospora kikuchii]
MSLASANPYYYRTEDKSRQVASQAPSAVTIKPKSESGAISLTPNVSSKERVNSTCNSTSSTSSTTSLVKTHANESMHKWDARAQRFLEKVGLAPANRPQRMSPAYERPGQISLGY